MALRLAALLLSLGLGTTLASSSSSSSSPSPQPPEAAPLRTGTVEPRLEQQAGRSASASASTASAASTTNSTFQDQCASFDPAAAGIANATVTRRAFVAANATVDLAGDGAACGQAGQLVAVDLCRVALQIATTGRSGVVAEVWLPAGWNGRLLTTGNGGLGGCVDYATMAYTAQNGFASVGTNNGHNGTSGIQFLNNEDVIIDFSWRALHVGVEAGKALLAPFYGREANKSYLLACSLGGRQAIQAADRFPADFDGVVAGAPAADFNNLYSWRARFFPLLTSGAAAANNTNTSAAGFITPATWKTTIHDEVLRQCDGLDGVMDGIIEDSSLCRFDPDALLCGGGDGANSTTTTTSSNNSSACLTAAQVEIVRTIFSPYEFANGTLLYPAMNPGSEILAADGLYSGQPWAPSASWFRYAVHDDPAWDPASYTLSDALAAGAADPGGIRTWPSSLAAFEARGGRAVVFHGGQDNQISSFNSPRLYERLRAGMVAGGSGSDNNNNATTARMDAFLRLFRVSGMFHCQGGPGAWVLGQAGGAAAQGPYDAAHNVLAALVRWVEDGVAPETMTGTKYVNDTAGDGVAFERRHCRWPLRNTYLGAGRDARDPASWECRQISQADEQMGADGSEAAGNTTSIAVTSAAAPSRGTKSVVMPVPRPATLLSLFVLLRCMWLALLG